MLLLVAVGGRFIGYLQEAAMGKFTGATVLTIIGLRMPEFVQLVAPFAMYVAIVVTLGRMHAEQEMVVLQGAGTSTGVLIRWIGTVLFAVVALVAILAWIVTPLAREALEDYLTQQRAQSEFETLNPGTFHVYDRGRRVTYSNAMSDDRRVLHDVFISQRLDNGVQVHVWAQQGTQHMDPATGSQYLILKIGRRYEVSSSGADMRVMEFAELRQRLETSTKRPDSIEPEAIATWSLGDDAESRAQWHWRMALPLFAIIGGLLAVGISRVKPRQGRFAKVVPAMSLMSVYFLALLVNQNAIAEQQIPHQLGMWLVHGCFFAVAVVLLVRVSRPVVM
jgi:lipopolysaccharide export system permease protein